MAKHKGAVLTPMDELWQLFRAHVCAALHSGALVADDLWVFDIESVAAIVSEMRGGAWIDLDFPRCRSVFQRWKEKVKLGYETDEGVWRRFAELCRRFDGGPPEKYRDANPSTASSLFTKRTPSLHPVEDLTPCSINDLSFGTNHGFVVEGRVSSDLWFGIGFGFVFEDKTGRNIIVTAYNILPPTCRHPASAKWRYSVGTLLMLKEPFMKAGMGGHVTIRIDHPSDLVILQYLTRDRDDGCREGWANLKTDGDRLASAGFAMDAAAFYTRAIANPWAPRAAKTLLLQARAKCYMSLGMMSRVLSDVNVLMRTAEIGKIDVPDEVMIMRGRALLELGHFELAHSTLQPFREEFIRAVSWTNAALEAAYPWSDMLEFQRDFAAMAGRNVDEDELPQFHYPDYASPAVFIRWVGPLRERRLSVMTFARLDAGAVVIVNRSLATEHCHPPKSSNPLELPIEEVAEFNLRKVMADRYILRMLYAANGPFPRAEPESAAPRLLNGCPMVVAPDGRHGPHIHGTRIDSGIKAGKLCIGRTERSMRLGVYPIVSLMRRSFWPNTIAWTVGSVLVIRAARDINEGEELTLSYGLGADRERVTADQPQRVRNELQLKTLEDVQIALDGLRRWCRFLRKSPSPSRERIMGCHAELMRVLIGSALVAIEFNELQQALSLLLHAIVAERRIFTWSTTVLRLMHDALGYDTTAVGDVLYGSEVWPMLEEKLLFGRFMEGDPWCRLRESQPVLPESLWDPVEMYRQRRESW
eukprot:Polyplicarium_translucidae@DN2890_c0_g1_i4.p1